jgi:hypothetical protein
MATPNYTPIQLYRTNTASTTAPAAGNLNAGELAINYHDSGMALYAKNSSGTVKKLINNPAGLTYPAADGAAYQNIQTDGSGTMSFAPSASSVLTAQGDLLYASGANTLARLAKSTTATRYLSNTGTNNNPAWAQVDLTNGVTGTLPYGNGGTGVTAAATNGQLLIGNGSGFTLANITVSPPLSISNTAGGIALTASGLGTGDVIGPTSATDRAIAIYNGTGGKTIQDSTATVTPAGFLTANGLTFPAVQVSSADANTLDDYEEGTWTPEYTGIDILNGDVTPAYFPSFGQRGRYVKIGSVVFVSCRILLSSLTVTGATTGDLYIQGLPYVPTALSPVFTPMIAVGISTNWSTNAPSFGYFSTLSWTLATGSISLLYKTAPNALTFSTITSATLTSTTQVTISGFYYTDT